MTGKLSNPYIGPRPFSEEEWELFFGREQEAADLRSLVLVDRVVLFYAPSGAGKTSLINTSLRRALTAQGFDVLPKVSFRSGDVTTDISNVANIFVYSLITAMGRGQLALENLPSLTLKDYLMKCRQATTEGSDDAAPSQVLIIDQFEEMFNSHLEKWEQRKEFFQQLSDALAEPKLDLWVILSMREEYAAMLDPYVHLLPGRLRTRYYMQQLDREAALEAITVPARRAGKEFDTRAAEELRDNLSLIRVGDHDVRQYPGEFVEPVQLQVVCWQLWEDLKTQERDSITMEDVSRLAGGKVAEFVDSALARFYESNVRETAGASSAEDHVSEYRLRNWVDEKLITERDTRNLVYMGETTEGLPNSVVLELQRRLLIHGEKRPAGTWYELIHDRLIEPIRRSNRDWYKNQPAIVRLARDWEKSEGEDKRSKLVGGPLLQEAEQQIRTAEQGNVPLASEVLEYVEASRRAQAEREQEQAEQERQQQLALDTALQKKLEQEQAAVKSRRLARAATAFAIIAIILSVVALWFMQRAKSAEDSAKSAEAKAISGSAEIMADKALAAFAVSSEEHKPQLGLVEAVAAVEQLRDVQGEQAERAWPKVVENLRYLIEQTGGMPLRDGQNRVIDAVASVVISPDGRRMAAVDHHSGSTVHLWNLAGDQAEQEWRSLGRYDDYVTAASFGPTGNWLVLGHQSGAIDLVDLQPFSPVTTQLVPPAGSHPMTVTVLAVSPSPGRWLVVGDESHTVRLYEMNWQGYRATLTYSLFDPVSEVELTTFSPQGRWLATVTYSDTLSVWNLTPTTDQVVTTKALSTEKNGLIAFSPDDKWLAAASKEPRPDEDIQLWQLSSLDSDVSFILKHGRQTRARASSLLFLPVPTDQKMTSSGCLVVGHEDGQVLLWDLPVPERLDKIIENETKSKADSSRDEFAQMDVGSSGPAEPLLAVDLSKSIAPRTLAVHTSPITALASLDVKGKWLASASDDHTACLWQTQGIGGALATKCPRPLYGHDVGITQISFGTKPTQLITVDDEKHVRYWDLTDKPPRPTLEELELLACSRAADSWEGQAPEDDEYLPGKAACEEILDKFSN